MTTLEKIDYIISYLGISEKKFLKRFNISEKTMRSWRKGESLPVNEDIHSICATFKLSEQYFLDDKVDISRTSQVDEKCHILESDSRHEVGDSVPEDYQRVDNSRYEEKD